MIFLLKKKNGSKKYVQVKITNLDHANQLSYIIQIIDISASILYD